MSKLAGLSVRIDADRTRRLRAAGIWRNRTIAEDARDWAAREPDRICMRDAHRAVTYREILCEAEGLAAGLHALGLTAGDVVSFQLPNWIEAAAIDLAASLLGLVVNPIVPIYREHETTAILKDCGARVLFIPDTYRKFDYLAMARSMRKNCPELEHIVVVKPAGEMSHEGALDYGSLARGNACAVSRPVTAPESIKFVLYTSGTTGVAKGVLHTHETIARVLRGCMEFWRVDHQDAILMPSPVTHITGYLWGLEAPFCWGSPTVLMERWNADEAIDLIERHAVAMTVSATTFLQELLDAAERKGTGLASLRAFACGGASVPPALIHRANRMLTHCRSFRVYGATEVPLVGRGCVDPEDDTTAAETDGIIVDFDVKILLDDGRPAADGVEGEIAARGAGQCVGYVDPETTRVSFDEEGYFHTGDLGFRTPGGALVITGRKKDLIIRGGENISAKEIEDILIVHPAVRDVAVVSMPHPRLGETVCAFVISSDPALTLTELIRHLEKTGIARQKFPERLELVADMPRTAAGKIKKDMLRALAARLVAA
jgi:non-ribosomal peptide synthetase component E (peptide arylation enzyme)